MDGGAERGPLLSRRHLTAPDRQTGEADQQKALKRIRPGHAHRRVSQCTRTRLSTAGCGRRVRPCRRLRSEATTAGNRRVRADVQPRTADTAAARVWVAPGRRLRASSVCPEVDTDSDVDMGIRTEINGRLAVAAVAATAIVVAGR